MPMTQPSPDAPMLVALHGLLAFLLIAMVALGIALLDHMANSLARTVQVLFYVVVVSMISSGIALSRQAGLPDIIFRSHGTLPLDFWIFAPRSIHYLISRLLILLFVVHLGGVLYHSLILRDGLLARMRLRDREPASTP